jgi:hypothetical protein
MSYPSGQPLARTLSVLTLGLACAASWAGTAEVSFTDPAKFSDVRDPHGGQQTGYQAALEAHLKSLADKILATDQSLSIVITDIDLAGEIEPLRPRMEMIRVMRSHTWPHMTLNYTLRDSAGNTLRSASAKISDMDYMGNSRMLSDSDPYRFEKQMLDTWFKREFKADATR